jgi:hypothetical protein
MADHGKNRRRSYYARKRQNRGKFKAMMNTKSVTAKIKFWWNYWHGPIDGALIGETEKGK